jgi:NTP pyrophosphatase (non-canonical NTP hydrolase)
LILDIQDIFDTNLSRCQRWHERGIQDWSPLEWAGAMAGEAGEAANAAKKLKRIETNMMSINESARHYTSVEDARIQVAKEVADTILYGLLLMARVGVNMPGELLREVFNKKSEDYGFPERL